MASRVFPIGTPLTVVWHFSKPDGTTFDLSGYTYRVYYRTGNRQTEVNSSHLTASGNMLTVVIPADMQYAPGEYSLKLVLYQNSSIFCTLVYNVAFVLSQQMSGDPTTETQSEGGNTVHLYTVAEFYMFSPVVPTVGNDGYWYVNGNKISDGNGEFIPSSHTVEYDPATNRIIIDRGRVNQQGQSIAQVITSLADALGIASQSHNTAEQDHDRAETDHDNAGDDHTNAQSDHEAIQQLIEQYEPIVINGDVTNAPDEEDITSDSNDLLKLKDRGTIYGMGYKILRRNKTFAEQVTAANTIYEIRYDFDLDGTSVVIPENSVLKLEGGSINNGGIVGNNTVIDAPDVLIFSDILISGTWATTTIYVGWFDINYSINSDNAPVINKIVNMNGNSVTKILFPSNKTIYVDAVKEGDIYTSYLRDGNINIPSNTSIDLNGSTLKVIANSAQAYNCLFSKDKENIEIKNGYIVGDKSSHDFSPSGSHEWGYGISIQGCRNVVLSDLSIKDCVGDAINLQDSFVVVDGTLSRLAGNKHIFIANCVCKDSGRNNLSIESGDYVTVHECDFSGAYRVAPKADIDIEPSITTGNCSNVLIENCTFNNSYYSILITNLSNNDIIKDIYIDGCIITAGILQINKIFGKVAVTDSQIPAGTNIVSSSSVSFVNCSFAGSIRNESSSVYINRSSLKTLTPKGTNPVFKCENTLLNGDGRGVLVEFDANDTIDVSMIQCILSSSPSDTRSVIMPNTAKLSIIDSLINSNGSIEVGANTLLEGCKLANACVFFGVGGIVRKCTLSNVKDTPYHSVFTFTKNTTGLTCEDIEVISVNTGVTYLFGKYASPTLSGIKVDDIIIPAALTLCSSEVKATGAVRFKVGTTSMRPSLASSDIGFQYFDETMIQPIWWNGSAWVDATGTAVE